MIVSLIPVALLKETVAYVLFVGAHPASSIDIIATEMIAVPIVALLVANTFGKPLPQKCRYCADKAGVVEVDEQAGRTTNNIPAMAKKDSMSLFTDFSSNKVEIWHLLSNALEIL